MKYDGPKHKLGVGGPSLFLGSSLIVFLVDVYVVVTMINTITIAIASLSAQYLAGTMPTTMPTTTMPKMMLMLATMPR
eukprot:13074608-Alexandrium_andersonii.AAC.1